MSSTKKNDINVGWFVPMINSVWKLDPPGTYHITPDLAGRSEGYLPGGTMSWPDWNTFCRKDGWITCGASKSLEWAYEWMSYYMISAGGVDKAGVGIGDPCYVISLLAHFDGETWYTDQTVYDLGQIGATWKDSVKTWQGTSFPAEAENAQNVWERLREATLDPKAKMMWTCCPQDMVADTTGSIVTASALVELEQKKTVNVRVCARAVTVL